jgi:cyclic di-GMP phosphodiesterase
MPFCMHIRTGTWLAFTRAMERNPYNSALTRQAPNLDSAGPAQAQTSVLIVDDERGPRESLRMILAGQHRVLTAESGASALDILRTEPIDLVTVDLNMPGMKGDELMRTVRAEFPQVELIIITGCGSIETAVEGLRHGVFDYLTKPFDVVQVMASVERAMTRRMSRGRMVSFLESIGRVLGPERDSKIVLEELENSAVAQERLRRLLEEPVLGGTSGRLRMGPPRTIEFLEVLAETIESRDLFMRGHARRVAFFADLVADRLLLSVDDRDHIRIAAFLHDIGKVGAPSDMLEGKVMPEPERLDAIQAHSAIGERLLRPLGLSDPITISVRHHHERYDGSGYPDGLAGDDIPLGARVIAITDSYDAMTCERPYRRARTQEEACSELRKEALAQFDPNLVEIFIDLIESGATNTLGDAATLSESTLPSAGEISTVTQNQGAA